MKALRRLKQVGGRQLVIGIPFFWLFLFFLLPFIIVVKISFAEADVAIPPYTDVVSWPTISSPSAQPGQLPAAAGG